MRDNKQGEGLELVMGYAREDTETVLATSSIGSENFISDPIVNRLGDVGQRGFSAPPRPLI